MKYLFIWELGDGLGHFSLLNRYINKLAENNTVYFASRTLVGSKHFTWHPNVKFIIAPSHIGRLVDRALTFADIIRNCGMSDTALLEAQIKIYRNLYDLISPDVVFFDHAPTATLAASSYAFKKIALGVSYTTPSHLAPTILVNDSLVATKTEVIESDKSLCDIINPVLTKLGIASITSINGIYNYDSTIIAGYPCVDMYSSYRLTAMYTGAYSTSSGTVPEWRSSFKIFAYLKWENQITRRVLESLLKFKSSVVCYCPGMPAEVVSQLSASMTVSNQPYDYTCAMSEVDLIISHGGQGVISDAVHYGVPSLLVPTQLEQLSNATLLKKLGVAEVAFITDSTEVITSKLTMCINNKSMKLAAEQLIVDMRDKSKTVDFILESVWCKLASASL